MNPNGRPPAPVMDRFMKYVSPEPNSGCWLWTGNADRGGYGSFEIRGKTLRAHRVAWELFKGPIGPGLLACHRCDNRACVNPGHLFLGSDSDNVRDMVAKGRAEAPSGHRNGRSKLTENQVLQIRWMDGIEPADLAAEFGVSESAIKHVLAGRSWRHLGGGGR